MAMVVHLVGLAALAQAGVETLQSVLDAPADLQEVVGLAGLAVGDCGADPWRSGVVPGGLDEAVFVIEPWPDSSKLGVSPSHENSLRREPKRCQSPPSSRSGYAGRRVSDPASRPALAPGRTEEGLRP
jgi:hypothetical protein